MTAGRAGGRRFSLLGRRRFIGLSAAAVCVGCSDQDADPATGATPAPTAPTTPTTPPTTLTTTSPTVATTEPVPSAPSPFGPAVEVGRLSDFDDAAAPVYAPEARAWIVTLEPKVADAIAAAADERLRPGLEHGLLALYQKCPHLGCRVPYCDSSGWFECRCHGTMFNRNGEHREGPGPRGLDAFAVVVDGDTVFVDSSEVVPGAPAGTVVVDRPPDGPHCVDSADH